MFSTSDMFTLDFLLMTFPRNSSTVLSSSLRRETNNNKTSINARFARETKKKIKNIFILEIRLIKAYSIYRSRWRSAERLVSHNYTGDGKVFRTSADTNKSKKSQKSVFECLFRETQLTEYRSNHSLNCHVIFCCWKM